MPSTCSRPLAILAAILCVLGVSACAKERPAINRVQANALAKSFFVGDPGNPNDDPSFYWRNFVVGASESQELVGVGSSSGLDRIRWEITESTLYARRAYPQNLGADDSRPDNGTIVAAYPILSHFDIKRDYNPQTGEQLNIVVENTTDRPWYERDYFRVDWSVNQVDGPDWLDMFIGKITGDLKLTNVAYYVSDASNDDAPHFDPAAGYFDVTSKFTVEPTPSSLVPGWPECALLGSITGSAIQNCDGQEAIVRSSYWRVDQVDPDGDFEPFENTRAFLDIIGNPGGFGDSVISGEVTPPLVSWDPGYGYVDPNMKRLMNLHDIWQQSHQTRGSCKLDADCASIGSGSTCLPSGRCTVPCSYAARGDGDADGTDDQCENAKTKYAGSAGSQCSVRNRCTIPYRDRKTKPAAYWVDRDMPDSLQDTLDSHGKVEKLGPTEEVVHTWNQAVNLAVAHAREVECRRTGGDRTGCHEQYFDTKNPIDMVSFGGWGIERVKSPESIIVTCHNPVRDYDPEACGERNTTARIGDMRHHFIFYWPHASRAPWGGIANFAADPLTGQVIGSSATVMGRSVTWAAAQNRDIFMVANHELDMTDITGGVPASLYQQTLRLGQKRTALTTDELARRTSALDVKNAAHAFDISFTGTSVTARLAQAADLKTRTTADPGMLSAALAESDAVAKPLLGSQYEAQLVSPSWLVDSQGLSPSTQVDDSVLGAASPLRALDPVRMKLFAQTAMQRLSSRGVCLFAGGDAVGNPDIRGAARFFGDQSIGIYRDDVIRKTFPELAKADDQTLSQKRAELIYDDLTQETYKGILLHELGHTLGMLHNFASSYDSENYLPQYWQLRTNEGASTASCNGAPRTNDTDSCMGPRFLDPETDDELGQADESRPGIYYFANTSTMEYQHERFFESSGLGTYDVMTMGALYGRVLETFDPDAPDGVPIDQQPSFQSLNDSQLTEDNFVDWTTPRLGRGVQPMHYTELARRIHLYDPSRCRAATSDEVAHARWRIVHGKVCAAPPKDHTAWQDFTDDGGPKTIVSAAAPAAAGQVRWPYRYGQLSDAYVHVNPSDSGADPYEVVEESIRKYDYSYPFTYFRRQRRDWNYLSLPSNTARDFFERLRSYHWVVDFNLANLSAAAPAGAMDTLKNTDDNVRGNVLASTRMLDVLSRVVLAPEIGDFSTAGPSIQLGTDHPLYDAAQNGGGGGLFSLDASNARFVDPDYDTGAAAGGSWDYLTWLKHAGFEVEKSFAAMALSDGRPTLEIIRRDTYIDGRDLYVNFRTDLATGVDRLLGGILSSDWEAVAPYVSLSNSPDPTMLSLTDGAPARPSNALLLFPNLGYKQQLGALIFAEIYSRLGTDLSLMNKVLVYLEGTQGVIDFPDTQKIKFSDPRSGFTYVARLYGPDVVAGKTVDRGIGSRMLAHANALLARAYQVQLDTDGKPVLDAFGQPSLVLDASGQPIPTNDGDGATAFSNYVGLVDAAVQVARKLGHGPLESLSVP